jgi:cell division protein FtsB
MNDQAAERKSSAGFMRGSGRVGIPSILPANRALRLLVLFLIGLNCALIYGLFFSGQGILAYRHQCAQVEDLEAKVLKLRKENQKLYMKIQAFKNDPDAQERLVRQQLGWAKGNELVVEFTPSETRQQE